MQKVRKNNLHKHGPLAHTAVMALLLISFMLLLSTTVFAQNTYVITDGNRVLVHTTFATDPAAVLDEAGLELNAEDTYTTEKGDGVSEIKVQRGDKEDTGTTQPQVLAAEETYTVSIPYEVRYCYDASIPEGTEKVLTEGEEGQMVCTADVVYQDGVELSRDVTDSVVTEQPVTELIARGTGDAELAADYVPENVVIGDGTITLPTGEVLTYTDTMMVGATAYDWQGITAMGTTSRVGAIAVDPSVIPYGTRMFIVSNDGEYVYGICTAEDTGDPNFISGNRVDLFFDTYWECIEFGYRECTVYFLGEADFSYGQNP